ncbi:hypothetical protein H4F18_10405 [Vibrio scophthalmi]|uniref:hypothetical protein n=1 Tax=Vibrio scophthalmi TaxID=45658 RepID=UPI002FF36EBA
MLGSIGQWWTSTKSELREVLEFQSRVWVVNVFSGRNKGEAFIVNEDSFNEPMQWMKRKGYPSEQLARVSEMKRSQVLEIELSNVKHRVMRVK